MICYLSFVLHKQNSKMNGKSSVCVVADAPPTLLSPFSSSHTYDAVANDAQKPKMLLKINPSFKLSSANIMNRTNSLVVPPIENPQTASYGNDIELDDTTLRMISAKELEGRLRKIKGMSKARRDEILRKRRKLKSRGKYVSQIIQIRINL